MGSLHAPKSLCFGAIGDEHFLKETRLLSSLEKMNSSVLQKEFLKDCRRFLEDLVSTVLSTVAVRSPVGQGLSCFYTETIIGVDVYSPLHLFGHLLDGLLELGWIRGSEIELAEEECHSFVREQQQVEVSGSRSRVPINSVSAICNQPGICSRRNLRKVSIMMLRSHLGLLMILHVCCFQVFQLTALVVMGPSASNIVFTVSLEGVVNNHEKVNGAVPCVQDFVRHPLFTRETSSLRLGSAC